MYKAKIVVVEDNASIRRLVQIKLVKENYKVDVFEDGIEGLEGIMKIKPDLAILDVMLPGMKGFEILKKLREGPETKNLKVIMFTSMSEPEYVQMGFELNVSDFISKPFEIDELLKRVNKVMRK